MTTSLRWAMGRAAGANSIFYGDNVLTSANPQAKRDRALLDRLGLRAQGDRSVPGHGNRR